MSLAWNLLFLGLAAYGGYQVFAGFRDGRIESRFAVFADRKEDPLMFWLVAVIWSLVSMCPLLILVITFTAH